MFVRMVSANLGAWLNQKYPRWVIIFVTTILWFQVANLTKARAGIGDIIAPFLVGYLWVVTCKCYGRVLANGKGHISFWWRYAAWMGASLVMFFATDYGNGLFWTAVLAFIIERNTAGGGGSAVHLRGAALSRLIEVKEHYNRIRGKSDPGILWGGVRVPIREATTHFCVAGTSGSGKTVTLRLFMQDVLTGIGQPHSRKRAVLYDPKIEMYPILLGMGFRAEDIIVMNPFDQRCHPWAIAEDIETATDAQNLAEILVPRKDNSSSNDDFWRSATILLIKAVVRYLNIRAPKVWQFRDLLLALRSRKIILRMIEDESRLDHYKQAYGSDKTADNIMSTLLVQIEKYEPIASLWHKAETVYGNKPVSLTEWTHGSKILLLGKSETAETEMREVNRVLITRVAELLLEKEETREAETFLILDELSSLGDMKPLIKVAEEGRSKGVCLAVGFQAKEHIEKNFSKELANAFLGQFNHIAALRLRDEQTAKWITEIIGKKTGIRYTTSETASWDSPKSYSVQEQHFEEYAAQVSELTSIEPFRPDLGIGLKGLYMGHKYWWHTYSPDIVGRLAPKAEVSAFQRMPKAYQDISPWDEQDYQRLNISHLQDIPLADIERFFDDQEMEA